MTTRQESATIEFHYSSRRSTIDKIQRLKSMSNISSININIVQVGLAEEHSQVVDSLVNLLNTNHNITSLNCKMNLEPTTSLFEALAAGKAGYNLESLQQNTCFLGEAGATGLLSYLMTNRNLKRLAVVFHGPPAVQLVSSLDCSTVVELELHVFDICDCLRELGSKLGQCNSIASLTIHLYHITNKIDDIKSFFKEGLANMLCLTNIEIHFTSYAVFDPGLHVWQGGFLEMIKASRSITKASLRYEYFIIPSFNAEVDSFCILNRVFGTHLIGFEPTALWTRVLAKIHNNSARATFLFRLLREKPELLIGTVQSVCKGSKRQRMILEGATLLSRVRRNLDNMGPPCSTGVTTILVPFVAALCIVTVYSIRSNSKRL